MTALPSATLAVKPGVGIVKLVVLLVGMILYTGGFVAAPKVSVKSQRDARLAELSSSEGEIYFTVDGTDPRASGGLPAKSAQAYKTPIDLRPGAKLFARVRNENRWSGPVSNVE